MGNKNVFIRFLIGTAIRQTDAITVFVMRIAPASGGKKTAAKISRTFPMPDDTDNGINEQ